MYVCYKLISRAIIETWFLRNVFFTYSITDWNRTPSSTPMLSSREQELECQFKQGSSFQSLRVAQAMIDVDLNPSSLGYVTIATTSKSYIPLIGYAAIPAGRTISQVDEQVIMLTAAEERTVSPISQTGSTSSTAGKAEVVTMKIPLASRCISKTGAGVFNLSIAISFDSATRRWRRLESFRSLRRRLETEKR